MILLDAYWTGIRYLLEISLLFRSLAGTAEKNNNYLYLVVDVSRIELGLNIYIYDIQHPRSASSMNSIRATTNNQKQQILMLFPYV